MSGGTEHGDETLVSLAVKGLQRTIQRVDRLEVGLAQLAKSVAEGRREDMGYIADKIERGFERVARDAGEREARLNARLDRLADAQALIREEQKDICDKGQKDHAAMKAESADLRRQVTAIQKHLSVRSAREQGRKDVLGWLWNSFNTISDNWGKVSVAAVAVVALAKAFWPPVETATAVTEPTSTNVAHIPPVTNQQETLGQAHVEDWPLRTQTYGND